MIIDLARIGTRPTRTKRTASNPARDAASVNVAMEKNLTWPPSQRGSKCESNRPDATTDKVFSHPWYGVEIRPIPPGASNEANVDMYVRVDGQCSMTSSEITTGNWPKRAARSSSVEPRCRPSPANETPDSDGSTPVT